MWRVGVDAGGGAGRANKLEGRLERAAAGAGVRHGPGASPSVQTYRGSTISFDLSKSVTEGLQSLSREEGVTLYVTLWQHSNVPANTVHGTGGRGGGDAGGFLRTAMGRRWRA